MNQPRATSSCLARIVGAMLAAFLCISSLAFPAYAQDPGPQSDPAFSGCTRIDVAAVHAAYEQQVVELVNQRRAENNLPPLKRNSDLDYAARYHAKDMKDDNYFEHDSYDRVNGNLTKVCATFDRVKLYYPWNAAGENIAWGYGSPESVMDGWMKSSGHKANILRSSFREIGVGYYTNNLWVQDFGTRNSVYPIVINREAAQTDTNQVSLYIYGQGVWNEMRLRSDSGAWTAWQPFQATLNWTLPGSKGVHNVSVELRKKGGATGASSTDSIELTKDIGIQLGNLPTTLTFLYNQDTGVLSPPSTVVQPKNTSSSDPMTWSTVQSPDWILLDKTTGACPDETFTVSLRNDHFGSPGSHDGTITVTASGGSPVINSPQVIQVRLMVVEAMPYSVYLPTTYR